MALERLLSIGPMHKSTGAGMILTEENEFLVTTTENYYNLYFMDPYYKRKIS